MKLSITQFAGMAPKLGASLLPDNFAQEANETKFGSGELRAFYEDQDIISIPNDTTQVYKYYIPRSASTQNHVWLCFNKDVHIVKGPIFGDANNRIVISGLDSQLRVTDKSLIPIVDSGKGYYNPVSLSTSHTYVLGIPRLSGITMALENITTDRENIESRSYTVALVREWGDGKLDVGGLSDPATRIVDEVTYFTIDVATGETVKLSNIRIPTSYYNTYGVRKVYIYRSTVGSDGTATYGYVGEIAIDPYVETYTFSDSRSAEDVEESAVSSEWDAPINNLKGVVSLNNGVMAAYTGSDIYFSYPYQIHAWPYTYRVSVDYDIVGLGAFGNTVVVCTKGAPALILVSDPAAPTLRAINEPFPCMSAKTIVNFASGVVYASTSGLLWVNSTSPKYLTTAFIDKDSWREYDAANLICAGYEGKYVGVSLNPVKHHGIIVDIENINNGITSFYRTIAGAWSDPEANDLYFIVTQQDGSKKLTLFDTPRASGDQFYRTYNWKSKVFTSKEGISTLAAARIRTEGTMVSRMIVSTYSYSQHTINGATFNKYDVNGPIDLSQVYLQLERKSYIYFIYYINGIPRLTKVVKDSTPFRLPSGFRGDTFEVEVESASTISSIELASSMGELM